MTQESNCYTRRGDLLVLATLPSSRMPSRPPWLSQVPLLGSHNLQGSSTCLSCILWIVPVWGWACLPHWTVNLVRARPKLSQHSCVHSTNPETEQALRKGLHGSNSRAHGLTCRPHPEWITGHMTLPRLRTAAVAFTDKLTGRGSRQPTPQLCCSWASTACAGPWQVPSYQPLPFHFPQELNQLRC